MTPPDPWQTAIPIQFAGIWSQWRTYRIWCVICSNFEKSPTSLAAARSTSSTCAMRPKYRALRRRIVSAAARRSILVGCGGAVLAPKNVFSKDSRKTSFYPQKFLMTFFNHQKLQQNKCTVTMASAARRQIISGGAPVNKSRRRCPQIVGGATRPAQGCGHKGRLVDIALQ